jgi:hypothetical protein
MMMVVHHVSLTLSAVFLVEYRCFGMSDGVGGTNAETIENVTVSRRRERIAAVEFSAATKSRPVIPCEGVV